MDSPRGSTPSDRPNQTRTNLTLSQLSYSHIPPASSASSLAALPSRSGISTFTPTNTNSFTNVVVRFCYSNHRYCITSSVCLLGLKPVKHFPKSANLRFLKLTPKCSGVGLAAAVASSTLKLDLYCNATVQTSLSGNKLKEIVQIRSLSNTVQVISSGC